MKFLLENNSSHVEKTLKKYSDELLSTVSFSKLMLSVPFLQYHMLLRIKSLLCALRSCYK